ncbi:MAG: hypothetical protein IPM82_24940 [Saprospiraceae bacterium]|nr:hypothetical protein [Saprospiraceae bacterium]
MENNVEAKVKELVTDFKLEEALDILIAQAQTQTQRKQNALLVLKGKLALLEEQSLACMLDPGDVARQKAGIAHQILDIADGSPLDHEIPTPSQSTRPEQVLVQKTVSIPATGGASWVKYLLIAALLVVAVVAGIFISKSFGEKKSGTANEPKPVQPSQEQTTDVTNDHTTSPSGGPLRVLDFPNLQQPFNFLDFGYEFRWADAEWISDSEIRLKMRCYITCKSNLGICYRATVQIYADGKPIAPAEQSNTAGWVEHNATITDDISFVLPADAKEFHIELSRDKSTWKRPFKILR